MRWSGVVWKSWDPTGQDEIAEQDVLNVLCRTEALADFFSLSYKKWQCHQQSGRLVKEELEG